MDAKLVPGSIVLDCLVSTPAGKFYTVLCFKPAASTSNISHRYADYFGDFGSAFMLVPQFNELCIGGFCCGHCGNIGINSPHQCPSSVGGQ
jgi:hypothetical protein